MDHVLNLIGHKLLYEDIISADNCMLIDSKGNKYLDLESGVWCTSIGHSNPNVVKTITENVRKIMHCGYCYNTNQVEKTAQKILEITKHENGKCVFLCSGSEVVDLGISIANHIIDKPLLLTMKDSYLSAFGNFLLNDPPKWYKYNWIEEENIENIPFNKIAAFIFEPGSSSGLVRFPPNNLIKNIADRIKQNGGIIIANEITTGIGRTGKWFGYYHYDIQPDMVAIGKGLGNGYPVSCLSLSSEIVNKTDLHSFHYSQSHQNDPLGAAIAYGVLTTIEQENLLELSIIKGQRIIACLTELKQKYGFIKEIRGRGLMIAIEFEDTKNGSVTTEIRNKLLEKRIILVKRPNHEVIRLDPSLTITEDNIYYFLETLENILVEMKTTG